MSRTFNALPTYTPGANTPVTITEFLQPAKDNADLMALGCFARSLHGGGSEHLGFGVNVGTGWLTAYDCVEFEIDNSNSQVSGSTNLICQVRVMVRVENAAMSFTPRIYNFTDSSVPTQSGAAACSATATDFSGTNQKQTINLTLPAGKKRYVVQGQKSADTYQGWLARIAWDIFING
jgi:hypothetical protein